MESTDQSSFVPAQAGTQALPQRPGSRFRGNERGMLQRQTMTLLLAVLATLTLMSAAATAQPGAEFRTISIMVGSSAGGGYDTYARVLPGRTAIFLPHRVTTIRNCDRILLFFCAQPGADGDHRQLLAENDLYRHLHSLEFNDLADQLSA